MNDSDVRMGEGFVALGSSFVYASSSSSETGACRDSNAASPVSTSPPSSSPASRSDGKEVEDDKDVTVRLMKEEVGVASRNPPIRPVHLETKALSQWFLTPIVDEKNSLNSQ